MCSLPAHGLGCGDPVVGVEVDLEPLPHPGGDGLGRAPGAALQVLPRPAHISPGETTNNLIPGHKNVAENPGFAGSYFAAGKKRWKLEISNNAELSLTLPITLAIKLPIIRQGATLKEQ